MLVNFLDGTSREFANLRGANLYGANLYGADGKKITLVGKRPYLQLGPFGSRCDSLKVFLTDAGVYVCAGCFWNTLDAFKAAVAETHPNGVHAEEYAAAIAQIEVHAKHWLVVPEAATAAA